MVLLADDGDDTQPARRLLEQRNVTYSEIVSNDLGRYKKPTMLVRGWAFEGFEEIRRAICTNQYF